MEYIALITLAGLFALIVALITLRFVSVIQQLKQSDVLKQAQLIQTIDASHTQAFTNAMSALESTQTRVLTSQIEMFNRTMDMVHGPQPTDNGQVEYAVDSGRLDNRQNWQINDDGDEDETLYLDPTDLLDPDPPIEPPSEETNRYRAVSVRPGEGLIPQ